MKNHPMLMTYEMFIKIVTIIKIWVKYRSFPFVYVAKIILVGLSKVCCVRYNLILIILVGICKHFTSNFVKHTLFFCWEIDNCLASIRHGKNVNELSGNFQKEGSIWNFTFAEFENANLQAEDFSRFPCLASFSKLNHHKEVF